MNEGVKVTFIIPIDSENEHNCSEEMQLAFVACEQHCGAGLQATWVHESQYNKFDNLTKRDVFVLSEFGGALYDRLKSTKCLVVGPRCLSCCLIEGTPIPSGPEPVFTIAMKGLSVTASGFRGEKKDDIMKKIHWMGGLYTNVLTNDTTHLVSNNVISDKYVKAVEKGIPVMSESWIDAVWDASLRMNVNGASPDFKDHKLPVFANLQVTTSGITKKDKQLIMKLVNENGGVFSGSFQSETTDVVVLTKENVGSEKYKAAIEFGKACVLPNWVKDSAAMGYVLPFVKYRVTGASTSSPLAGFSRLPDMSLNFSRITCSRPPSNFVEESRMTDMSTLTTKTKLTQDNKKTDSSLDKELITAFEKFDMSIVKRAGPIFDGFCIWLTGLDGIARDRASSLISRTGGVRYESAHERVTHIVAGNKASGLAASRLLTAVPVLTTMWLLDSVKAGVAKSEQEYILETNPTTPAKSSRKPKLEPASPMSKRNLQLLRTGPLDLPPPTPELPEVREEQDDLVNHYLSQHMPEPDPSEIQPEPQKDKTLTTTSNKTNATLKPQADFTATVDEPTEEIEQIFRGIKIEVLGLDEEAICEIAAEVTSAGGTLVAAGGGGDRVLVPLDFDSDELGASIEAVTVLWLKDCLSQQELLPIQYYHRPVKLPVFTGPLPLEGVVASLSTYSGFERAFLDELAKLLGATTQLRFCRRNTANALASTHLICPTASGDKYLGAVKWGLPAVKASWLIECAEKGVRVSEEQHLVGETKAPQRPQPPSPQKPTTKLAQVEQTNEQTLDKENAMLPPAHPAHPAVPKRNSVQSRDHTPNGKAGSDAEMSPASRYIAMARQGLLGCDSQETPKRVQDLKIDAKQDGEVRTPPLDDALSTPNLAGLSPTTRRRIQAVKRGEMPSDPIRTPADPFDKGPSTPDSGFGAALRPSGRMSPDARKRLWQVVNELPSKKDHQDSKQTPLSEIRNRFLSRFMGDAPTPPSNEHHAPRKLQLQEQADTPPAKMTKIHANQSAGSANITEDSNRTDSKNIDSYMKNFDSNLIMSPDSKVKSPNSTSKPASASKSNIPVNIDAQLERLNAALSGRNSAQKIKRTRDSVHLLNPAPESEPGPESQPNTVGWDDTTPVQTNITPPVEKPAIRRFMLSSNVDNREEIMEMILRLGGEVSDVAEVDPLATHLLCSLPGRSEKMLGSIAAGRWVLHPAYVARSSAQRKFLNEEEYEWGNPLATTLPTVSSSENTLGRAAYRWRVQRSRGDPGPFHEMAALLHVPPARKKLLARLVEAGGGEHVDDEPPYTNDNITVCFADIKRYPLSDRDKAWLISKRIPVCPPVLLSSYLTDEVQPKPEDHSLSDFRP